MEIHHGSDFKWVAGEFMDEPHYKRERGGVHLCALSALEKLDLSECPVDEAGMQALAQLHQVRELNLSRTTIPAAAFAHMQWPKNLPRLRLDKTQFDNAALKPLLTHAAIQSVGLLGTRVTRDGHDAFHVRRPGVLLWLPD